jgi:hypothetical protein
MRGENSQARRGGGTTATRLKGIGGAKWKGEEDWAGKREDGFDDSLLGTARRRLRRIKGITQRER